MRIRFYGFCPTCPWCEKKVWPWQKDAECIIGEDFGVYHHDCWLYRRLSILEDAIMELHPDLPPSHEESHTDKYCGWGASAYKLYRFEEGKSHEESRDGSFMIPWEVVKKNIEKKLEPEKSDEEKVKQRLKELGYLD